MCNKYVYLSVLQGYYGYGWEDLCQYDHSEAGWRKELRDDLRAYRENEGGLYRVIRRREPNPEYSG